MVLVDKHTSDKKDKWEKKETGERRKKPGYNYIVKGSFLGFLQIFIVYYEDISSFAAERGESQRLA